MAGECWWEWTVGVFELSECFGSGFVGVVFVDVDDEKPSAVGELSWGDSHTEVLVAVFPPLADCFGIGGGVVLPFDDGWPFVAGDDGDDVESGSCEFEGLVDGVVRHSGLDQIVLNGRDLPLMQTEDHIRNQKNCYKSENRFR